MISLQEVSDKELEAETYRRERIKRETYQKESLKRYREHQEKMETELKTKVQRVFPDITDAQLEELKDYFYSYHEEYFG